MHRLLCLSVKTDAKSIWPLLHDTFLYYTLESFCMLAFSTSMMGNNNATYNITNHGPLIPERGVIPSGPFLPSYHLSLFLKLFWKQCRNKNWGNYNCLLDSMFRKLMSLREVVNKDILLSGEGRRVHNCRFIVPWPTQLYIMFVTLRLLTFVANIFAMPPLAYSSPSICWQSYKEDFSLHTQILIWTYFVRQMVVRGRNILINKAMRAFEDI